MGTILMLIIYKDYKNLYNYLFFLQKFFFLAILGNFKLQKFNTIYLHKILLIKKQYKIWFLNKKFSSFLRKFGFLTIINSNNFFIIPVVQHNVISFFNLLQYLYLNNVTVFYICVCGKVIQTFSILNSLLLKTCKLVLLSINQFFLKFVKCIWFMKIL